jgi:hypothetical protein
LRIGSEKKQHYNKTANILNNQPEPLKNKINFVVCCLIGFCPARMWSQLGLCSEISSFLYKPVTPVCSIGLDETGGQ